MSRPGDTYKQRCEALVKQLAKAEEAVSLWRQAYNEKTVELAMAVQRAEWAEATLRQLAKHEVSRKVQRPECFEFGLDFMGDPEAREIRQYVEQLERALEGVKD